MEEEYYELLGVDPDASEETITAAYKDLLEELKEEEPDDIEQIFERAKRAHDVLTDEERRTAYDRRRERRMETDETVPSSGGGAAGPAEGVDRRIVALVVGLLVAVAVGEAVLLWHQSQRVDELQGELAAGEDQLASLEQNVSELRSELSATRNELQETKRINQEYDSLVQELADQFDNYKAIYSRCEQSDTCSVLGVEDPHGKFSD